MGNLNVSNSKKMASVKYSPAGDASASGDSVTVDLATAALSPEQLREIERRCNAEIRAARAVRTLVLDPKNPTDALRAVLSSPHFRGTLPPADKLKVWICNCFAEPDGWPQHRSNVPLCPPPPPPPRTFHKPMSACGNVF